MPRALNGRRIIPTRSETAPPTKKSPEIGAASHFSFGPHNNHAAIAKIDVILSRYANGRYAPSNGPPGAPLRKTIGSAATQIRGTITPKAQSNLVGLWVDSSSSGWLQNPFGELAA